MLWYEDLIFNSSSPMQYINDTMKDPNTHIGVSNIDTSVFIWLQISARSWGSKYRQGLYNLQFGYF